MGIVVYDRELLYTDDELGVDVYADICNDGEVDLYVEDYDGELHRVGTATNHLTGWFEVYFDGMFRKYDTLEALAYDYLHSDDCDYDFGI